MAQKEDPLSVTQSAENQESADGQQQAVPSSTNIHIDKIEIDWQPTSYADRTHSTKQTTRPLSIIKKKKGARKKRDKGGKGQSLDRDSGKYIYHLNVHSVKQTDNKLINNSHHKL